MISANKVKANPPITQRGTYGYLLWLRRDLPKAYAIAALNMPSVAAFEASLRAPSGLGDDEIDLSDLVDVASSADVSSVPAFDISGADQLTGAFDTGTILDSSIASAVNAPVSIDTSTILDQTDSPTLPPIAAPPADIAPSLPSSAAAVVPAAQLAQIVAGATQGAPKASGTNAAQLLVAAGNLAPLITGVVTTPAGSSYLAPLQPAPGSLSAMLSSSVAGIPVWILGLGAVGLIAVLAAKD